MRKNKIYKQKNIFLLKIKNTSFLKKKKIIIFLPFKFILNDLKIIQFYGFG